MAGKRVLLYTGGVKSWSMVSALQELGMIVVGTSVRKSTEEDVERVKEIMGEDVHTFDAIPPKEMYRMLKAGEVDVLMSGGRSQFVALKAGVPWIDVNQEKHHAFAGYDGMVTMVKEIDRSLSNPVWKELKSARAVGRSGGASRGRQRRHRPRPIRKTVNSHGSAEPWLRSSRRARRSPPTR